MLFRLFTTTLLSLVSISSFADPPDPEVKTTQSAVQDALAMQSSVTVFFGSGSVSTSSALTALLSPNGMNAPNMGQVILLDYNTVEFKPGVHRFQIYETSLFAQTKRDDTLPIIITKKAPMQQAKERNYIMESATPYAVLEASDPIIALANLVKIDAIETINLNVIDGASDYDFERLTEVLKLHAKSGRKKINVHLVGKSSTPAAKSSLKKFLIAHDSLLPQKAFPGVNFFLTLVDTQIENLRVDSSPVRAWYEAFRNAHVDPEQSTIKLKYENLTDTTFSELRNQIKTLDLVSGNFTSEIVQASYIEDVKLKILIDAPAESRRVPQVSIYLRNDTVIGVPVGEPRIVNGNKVYVVSRTIINEDFKVEIKFANDRKFEYTRAELRRGSKLELMQISTRQIDMFMEKMKFAELRADLKIQAENRTIDKHTVDFVEKVVAGYDRLCRTDFVDAALSSWIANETTRGRITLQEAEKVKSDLAVLKVASKEALTVQKLNLEKWRQEYLRRMIREMR